MCSRPEQRKPWDAKSSTTAHTPRKVAPHSSLASLSPWLMDQKKALGVLWECFTSQCRDLAEDTVSEWLRRWTRNPLGSARKGSNPFGVDACACCLCPWPKNGKWPGGSRRPPPTPSPCSQIHMSQAVSV